MEHLFVRDLAVRAYCRAIWVRWCGDHDVRVDRGDILQRDMLNNVYRTPAGKTMVNQVKSSNVGLSFSFAIFIFPSDAQN